MSTKTSYPLATLGLFTLVGLGCVGALALRLGDVSVFDDGRYSLRAQFVSASGLRTGAPVELAGVHVGEVRTIRLDPETFRADVELRIDEGVVVQEDAIASIRTSGIIGDKFVKIAPGGLDPLSPGMEIEETEPSVNLEELISKYIFESGDK